MQDKKFEPMQLLSNRDSVVHSMAGTAFLDQAFTNGETCFFTSGLWAFPTSLRERRPLFDGLKAPGSTADLR